MSTPDKTPRSRSPDAGDGLVTKLVKKMFCDGLRKTASQGRYNSVEPTSINRDRER